MTADGQIIIIRAALKRVSWKLSTPYLTRAYEVWAADGPADDADDAVILADTNLPGDLGLRFLVRFAQLAICRRSSGRLSRRRAQKAWSARLLQKEGRSPDSHLEMTQSLILTGPVEKCLDIVWRMI